MLYEYCVIGNGLIGAALALELSYKSRSVCVLGAAYGQDGRYYSSHEDDSRIARCWHSDPYWENLARRNIEKLQALAQTTALPLFRRTPVLYNYSPGYKPSGQSVVKRTSNHNPYAGRFEFEDVAGGIIDPRIYIAALNQEARKRNAVVLECVVRSMCWKDGKAAINTSTGEIQAKRVIEARGIHTPQAQVTGKILLYVETASGQLRYPFCFVDRQCSTEIFEDAYGIVDYRTSGNNLVSKFGFSERQPVRLNTAEEIAAWFQTDYQSHPHISEAMQLSRRFFAEEVARVYAKPCAFVITADQRPIITLAEHHGAITGCNGMAAKCCQSLAEKMVAMWAV